MSALQVLCLALVAAQAWRVASWSLERLSYTDTPIGHWLYQRAQRRRMKRWIKNGYRPHMDDRR